MTATVEFDFVGSLQLARELWSAASCLEKATEERERLVDAARLDWKGPHEDAYVTKFNAEVLNSESTAPTLRAEALAWAALWAEAKDVLKQRQDAEALANNPDLDPATLTPFSPTATPGSPDFLPTSNLGVS